MPAKPTENPSGHCRTTPFTILELKVANHPGVMSHICNLFTRRAFNLEGIICMPLEEGLESRIWLRVNEDKKLEQLVRQLDKLEDVREVHRNKVDPNVFKQLEGFFCCPKLST